MKICFFEDEKVTDFYPLVYFRSPARLRVGAFTIKEKVLRVTEAEAHYELTRSYLREYFDLKLPEDDEELLFINSRIIPSVSNLKKVTEGLGVIASTDGNIAAFHGTYGEFKKITAQGYSLRDIEGKVKLFSYIWDLIYANEELLQEDFAYFPANGEEKNREKMFHTIAPENIYIGSGVKIDAGVVLNAEEGPVIIDEGAYVAANAVIYGPAYIGKGSRINALAKLYGHLSIGPVCKIGGEVAETVIQGYSNKQHDGFLGHAYLGEWCNLGADTNNSDLKNNYGTISVLLNGNVVKTEHRFLGLIMGDHSKTAINTSFNTGTIVSVNCNIFARGFFKRFVPAFSWLGDEYRKEYKPEKAMEVAEIVMSRRGKAFLAKEKTLFRAVYELSKEVESYHGK